MNEAELIQAVWQTFKEMINPGQYRLYLYGSRARGNPSPYADFDFLIIGDRAVPEQLLTALRSRLEELPTLYSIDLVDFHQASRDFQEIACKHMKEVVDGCLRD
ncbi:MAG: nucleotidyltransferase domain-containing protein [Planctomycetes bacterium]|nr:nucleotidyltransferase domain-containing protein [Planctomycetota bacterium]